MRRLGVRVPYGAPNEERYRKVSFFVFAKGREPNASYGRSYAVRFARPAKAGAKRRKGATVKGAGSVNRRVRSGPRRPNGEPQDGRLAKARLRNPLRRAKTL